MLPPRMMSQIIHVFSLLSCPGMLGFGKVTKIKSMYDLQHCTRMHNITKYTWSFVTFQCPGMPGDEKNICIISNIVLGQVIMSQLRSHLTPCICVNKMIYHTNISAKHFPWSNTQQSFLHPCYFLMEPGISFLYFCALSGKC